jgi:anti-sigma factor RsiW
MSAPLTVTRKFRGFVQRNVPVMITCRELEEFIVDYLDGTLPWRQRLVFRIHLFFCRECRDYLASYTHTIALGKAALRQTDAPIPEELVRAILAARGRTKN